MYLLIEKISLEYSNFIFKLNGIVFCNKFLILQI